MYIKHTDKIQGFTPRKFQVNLKLLQRPVQKELEGLQSRRQKAS